MTFGVNWGPGKTDNEKSEISEKDRRPKKRGIPKVGWKKGSVPYAGEKPYLIWGWKGGENLPGTSL